LPERRESRGKKSRLAAHVLLLRRTTRAAGRRELEGKSNERKHEGNTMALKTLHDLFVHELRDIYNAEKQLLKALPKMAKAAASEKLQEGFEEHLEQTRGQVERLEQIFEQLEVSSRGPKCAAMEGLIEEGSDMIDEKAEDAVKDAGLIVSAQKVEHYEIATYGSLVTFARQLGLTEAESLLQETLDEEKETDAKLSELAESEINIEAEA
jgi:ferritin-like metal-binding protein YciE